MPQTKRCLRQVPANALKKECEPSRYCSILSDRLGTTKVKYLITEDLYPMTPDAYTFNLTKVMAPHLACKVCSSSVPILVIIVLLVTYPLVSEARKHLKNKIMRFPHQLMGLDSLRANTVHHVHPRMARNL